MPTQKEIDDLRLFEELEAKARANAAREFAEAKTAAVASGKEAFDLVALDKMLEFPGKPGVYEDPAVRTKRLEFEYYVDHPDINSLRAFATRLNRAALGS